MVRVSTNAYAAARASVDAAVLSGRIAPSVRERFIERFVADPGGTADYLAAVTPLPEIANAAPRGMNDPLRSDPGFSTHGHFEGSSDPLSWDPLTRIRRQIGEAEWADLVRMRPAPPPMFAEGMLPGFLNSGAPVAAIVNLPWRAQIVGAYADSLSKLREVIDGMDTDDPAAASADYYGNDPHVLAYESKIWNWASRPLPDAEIDVESAFMDLYGPEVGSAGMAA